MLSVLSSFAFLLLPFAFREADNPLTPETARANCEPCALPASSNEEQ